MSESNAVSSHGTLIKRNGVVIAELKDITPPALSRKPNETTTQNSDDDSFIMGGVRRHGEIKAMVNFLTDDPTHDASTGLLAAWEDKTKDGYQIDFPDGGVWIWSGYVQDIAPKAPVDGVQEADVTWRTTGRVHLT